MANGRVKEAKKVLKMIAEYNRKSFAWKEVEKCIEEVCEKLFVLHLNQTLYALCLSYYFSTEAVLLHAFRQAELPQRINCLAPRWEIALSIISKNAATRYRIRSRTKVSQPFDN